MAGQSSPELRIANSDASIRLVARERGPDGGIRFSVRLAGYGFSGRTTGAWVAAHEMSDFVRDLERLEDTRQGRAALRSMSPGELELCISSLGTTGHVRAEIRLSRFVFRRDWERPAVSVGFDFDPSHLPALVRSAQSLVAYQNSP